MRITLSPEFKVRAALSAIQGEYTVAQVVNNCDPHADQVTGWNKQRLNSAPDVFAKHERKSEGFQHGRHYGAVRAVVPFAVAAGEVGELPTLHPGASRPYAPRLPLLNPGVAAPIPLPTATER